MATANHGSHEFVIDQQADRLLSGISSDFSDLILKVASQNTGSTAKNGVPLVTVCDVADASELLCEVIRIGIRSGEIPPEASEKLRVLEGFCKLVIEECENDVGDSTDD